MLRVGCENVTMKSQSITNGMTTGTTGTTACSEESHRSECLLHACYMVRVEECMSNIWKLTPADK